MRREGAMDRRKRRWRGQRHGTEAIMNSGEGEIDKKRVVGDVGESVHGISAGEAVKNEWVVEKKLASVLFIPHLCNNINT